MNTTENKTQEAIQEEKQPYATDLGVNTMEVSRKLNELDEDPL